MDISAHPALGWVIGRAAGDPDVLAVIVFGSRARGDASPRSDLDVCLVLGAGSMSDVALGRKRLDYLAEGDVDLVVFPQLPLAVRSRILKEGVVGTSTGTTWSRWRVVDRDRLLARIDAMDGYLAELRRRLGDFEAFKREVLDFLRQAANGVT